MQDSTSCARVFLCVMQRNLGSAPFAHWVLMQISSQLKYERSEFRLHNMLCLRKQVTALQCDVGCTADVATLAAAIATASSGPITGIFHVGGALADATLAGQTAQSMRAVFAPKVQVLDDSPCFSFDFKSLCDPAVGLCHSNGIQHGNWMRRL